MKRFNLLSERSKEYTGPIQETDLLGSIDTADPKYRTALKEYLERNRKLIDKIGERKTLSTEERNKLFKEGVKLVESFPAEEPTHPSRPLLRDLRLQFVEKLGLEEKNLDRVQAFSSLGTPLDFLLFGADGFLKVDAQRPKGEPIYLTFDFTVNPGKNTTPADVLIKNLPDPDLEETEYVKIVDQAALDLYRIFLKKAGGRPVY